MQERQILLKYGYIFMSNEKSHIHYMLNPVVEKTLRAIYEAEYMKMMRVCTAEDTEQPNPITQIG